MISEILELNNKYIDNKINNSEKQNFNIITGSIPVIISAPHSIMQFRNGKNKVADYLTGPIAEYLAKYSNTHCIIRTFNKNDDPNYDLSGYGLEYKESLKEYIICNNIKVLIDLHGCKDSKYFDFQIGTNNTLNINNNYQVLNTIINNLNKIGKVVIDQDFKADGPGNISRYISYNLKIPCIQIEITSKFRKDPQKLMALIETLEELIKNINLII